MAYAFNDDKSKVDVYTKNDFVILTINQNMSGRQGYTEYARTVVEIEDDITNYIVIGAMQYLTGSGTSDELQKWSMNMLLQNKNSSNVVTNVSVYPTVKIYRDGSTNKIKFGLICSSNTDTTVTLRVVLMKIN